MNIKSIVLCIISFLFLTIFSSSSVYGVTYFTDNFSNGLDNWTFVSGGTSDQNSWKIVDNLLVGSVGKGESSYLYPKLSNVLEDFTLESNIKSVSGVDTNIFFRQSLDNQYYYVVGFRSNDPLWWQDNNNIVLYKYEYGYSLVSSYPSISIPRSFSLTQNVWHKIKIVVLGRSIKIYYDGVLAIDYYDNGTYISAGKISLQNWGGSYSGQVVNNFDNFIIKDNSVGQNKIIIIPGMGGSWNEKAMVLNQVVPQSEWKMTPFINNYDSLINGLNTNGLVKNTDYFIYNYDWRKPLSAQIVDFNNYINGLNILSGEKIDIVGHSLGGVIGRIWAQENSLKVGKVLTLASPNSGVLTAYEMWNGAKISNPTNTGSIALNILLNLQKKNNQTAVETLRSYVPVIKDLLPTFNYLKKNGVVVTPPVNSYLTSKNIDASSIFPQLLAVSGTGFNTNQWINLGERNIFDTISNRWEQGRPINYVLSDGDGTVLKNSSMFNGDGNANVVANHGNVPDVSVNLVLTELGLGKTITTIANTQFSGAVFYMGSPALMKVNCGSGDIVETDGFVLVSNKNIADCLVKLTGTDNGTYHLVMGNSADDESWKYAEGNISIGSTKNISVNMIDFWYEQMQRETNILIVKYPTNLYLKNMIIAINAKNRTNLLNNYLSFRKLKIETIVVWRMVNYLEKIINLEVVNPSLSTVTSAKNLAISAKTLAEKTGALMQRNKILPNNWQSLSYSQGEELLQNPNYGKYLLAEKIFAMVWY